jgi:hypothetical protein
MPPTRLAVLTLGFLLAAPALAQETWRIPEAGLTLEVPSGWTITESPRGERVLRRLDATGAGFTENVNVVASPARSESAEELKGAVRQQVEKGGVEQIRNEIVTISERRVVSLEYRGSLHGTVVRWRILALLNGPRQVVITAAILEERWESTREALEAMFAGMIVGEVGPAQQRERALHPTAGVSIVPPHGWVQLPSSGGHMWQLSRWAIMAEGRQARALLELRGEPVAPGATLDAVATQLSERTGIQLEEAALDLAGSPARVLRNDAAQGQQPRRIALCLHDGVVYSLVLVGPPGAVGVWQQVLLSLEWHERDDPSLHLDTLGAPMGISPNLMLLPPGLVRLMGKGKVDLRLGIHDYKHARGGMMLHLRGVGVQNPAIATEALRDQIAAQLQQQLQVAPESLTWDERSGDIPAFLSGVVKGKQGETLLFAVLRTAPNEAFILNVVIYSPELEAQAAYHEAVRRLLASARRPPQQR